MDFLNRAVGQLTDLLKSMTPGSRITAGLLLVMIVVSLAFLMGNVGSSPDTYLMGGEVFSGSQLHKMEAAFDKAGLTDYQLDGNRIRVNSSKRSAFMGALGDAGALPPTFGNHLEKTVGSSNIMLDNKQRQQATKIATQEELQLIISNMRGIETAAVLYDVEESGPFGKTRSITATVCVKTTDGMPLDEQQVRAIRHTVAPAIGAKAENISVTDLAGQVYPGSGGGGLVGGSEDPYGSRKRMYEKEWRDKITATLAMIPGVLVTANVELDPEIEHTETHTDYDPKPVPFNTRETAKKNVSHSAAPGGRPGVTSQGGSNQPAVVGTSNSSENIQEDEQTEIQSAVAGTVRHVAQQGLTPRRVTVAVSVPKSYYEKVWAEKNPPAAGGPPQKPDDAALAEIEIKVKKDIQAAVAALLPEPPGGPGLDPLPQVQVTSFETMPSPAMPKTSPADMAIRWLSQNWQTLGMIGLGLISLILLRSMVRAVPAAAAMPEPAEMYAARFPEAAPATEGQPAATPGVQNVRNRLKRRTPHGPSLREELSELVKEDPDTAVNVLRAWIGNSNGGT